MVISEHRASYIRKRRQRLSRHARCRWEATCNWYLPKKKEEVDK